ncbi:MAG: YggT family protein [Legionella sp.]|nr:MAG: YggT family protein [Legionella sp.]
MSGLLSVSYFLVTVLFGSLTFLLWARFGLQYFKISSLHPMSKIIHRFTDPILHPVARILQIRVTRNQRYDWVCFGVLVVVEYIKFLIIGALYFGHASVWSLTLAYTMADLIIQPCDLLFYALVIRVIMSWVNPTWQHPLASILYDITEPMLQRIRRRLPSTMGLDFSPFLMMIILKIITLFVNASLPFHMI